MSAYFASTLRDNAKHSTIDKSLLNCKPSPQNTVLPYTEHHKLPSGLKSIELIWPEGYWKRSHADDEDCLEVEWKQVKEGMLSAFGTFCPSHLTRLNEHWISSRSADLIAVGKDIPATNNCDSARRSLEHRMIRSSKNDSTLVSFEGPEDEKGLRCTLFHLVGSNGQKKPGVSKTMEREFTPSIVVVSGGLCTLKNIPAGLLQHNRWKNPAGLN
ncbi:hypothetical protein CLF_105747 [Clonorchis sinensis]|uniref:Uncharacterized protein n=1 Tax=Clonorchis sinensis TaxID=79923 RepID=G7YE47_CLOSI|nr:hypothetical protein CLF_105747 [Clonorchis sinensis]